MFIAPLGAITAGYNLSNSECLICIFKTLFTLSLVGFVWGFYGFAFWIGGWFFGCCLWFCFWGNWWFLWGFFWLAHFCGVCSVWGVLRGFFCFFAVFLFVFSNYYFGLGFLFGLVLHVPDHHIFTHAACINSINIAWFKEALKKHLIHWLSFMQSELGTCTADMSHCAIVFCHYRYKMASKANLHESLIPE